MMKEGQEVKVLPKQLGKVKTNNESKEMSHTGTKNMQHTGNKTGHRRMHANINMHRVASLLLVAMPGPPISFLLLVAMPGAPSSFLLLLVRHLLLVAMRLFQIASCYCSYSSREHGTYVNGLKQYVENLTIFHMKAEDP